MIPHEASVEGIRDLQPAYELRFRQVFHAIEKTKAFVLYERA
jgi:hypothetical protein